MSETMVGVCFVIPSIILMGVFLSAVIKAISEPRRLAKEHLEERHLARERLALLQCPNCGNEYGVDAAESAAKAFAEAPRVPFPGMADPFIPPEIWEVKCPTCNQISEFWVEEREVCGPHYEDRSRVRRLRQKRLDRPGQFQLPKEKSTGA